MRQVLSPQPVVLNCPCLQRAVHACDPTDRVAAAVIAFGPGGEAWFCAFLNSLIHVFMCARSQSP